METGNILKDTELEKVVGGIATSKNVGTALIQAAVSLCDLLEKTEFDYSYRLINDDKRIRQKIAQMRLRCSMEWESRDYTEDNMSDVLKHLYIEFNGYIVGTPYEKDVSQILATLKNSLAI